MSSNKDIVEILLATYNGALYLSEQIESLVNQTYSNWILSIRDDGSTDDTNSIIDFYIEQYPDKIRRIIDTDKNLGSTLNFAKLIAQSRKDYIMLCDQDDIWVSNKIELSMVKMKEAEAENKNLPCLIFTDLKIVDNSLKLISESFWKTSKHDPEITKQLYSVLANSVVTGCTILMNGALRSKVGLIPTSIIQHDHWISIFAAYYGKIEYLKVPTVLYRQHFQNDVGSRKINIPYLLGKSLKLPLLVQDWKKAYSKLPFKVKYLKVFTHKLKYNLKRMFNGL